MSDLVTPIRQKPTRVDGFLLLNKPADMTSNQALQRVKRLLNAKKGGHTGALDPAATGMLPLCFGEATKVCAYLLDADKTYRVSAKLGESRDTGDVDGTVTGTANIPVMDQSDWTGIIENFLGEIEQVPPMYSALKKDGKRFYELARQGQTVERNARPVTIHQIDLLEATTRRLVFRVRCSKGTYIRTLVEDIAAAAGTVAYTASLHRETVGEFRTEDMLDLCGVEKAAEVEPDGLRQKLMPADAALAAWPSCNVAPEDEVAFCHGQSVQSGVGGKGLVRVYGVDARFIGIGDLTGDGVVRPKRIFLLGE